MNISGVSPVLVNDWINSQIGTDRDNAALFVSIAQMTDAEKVASLTTYLQNRTLSDQSQITALSASTAATESALNADITTCNSALTSIGSSTVVTPS